MYLSHYNLKEKPFQISTDPKFIWLGENHQEALAVLEYGVIDNKGFLLITGDVGTGKTTLVNALLLRLGKDAVVANITNPILGKQEFLNFVAYEFNIKRTFNDKASFYIHFSRFLDDCYTKKKKVVLIVDEAHKLDQDLLEQIRLLSNIERKDSKLINIFFVGQNEFIDIISDKRQRALRQRITISYHLKPLEESEVKAYINHRLKVSGLKENIFSDHSVHEIFSFSNGYPRLINIICDHALLTGFVQEVKTIDEKIIKECANGLSLTRGNYDYYKHGHHTTQGTVSADEKRSNGTTVEITHRPNLQKERIDSHPDGPQTIERISHGSVVEPTLTASGKKLRYGLVALLLLVGLGVFYFPVNLSGHIDNMKMYFKPDTTAQEGKAPDNMLKNTTSKQKRTSADQDKVEYGDTRLQSTGLAVEGYQPSLVEKKNVVTPVNINSVKELVPRKDLSQEKPLDKTFKSKEVPTQERITSQKYIINFGYNSYGLSDKSIPTLQKIIEVLAQQKKENIIVKGYTDAYGNNKYNKKLSKLRANFVKKYVVDQGIEASRIKTFGMGEENPIAPNNTVEGRRRNRRAEIEFNI